MKCRLISLFFVITFPLIALGQKDNVPIGGRSAGMGNASITFADIWSAHNNQACMAYCTSIAAGVYYENRFMTKELGMESFAFVLPVKKAGVFGLNFSRFGNSLYNENKVGLAYAMSFGEKVSAGLQLDYIYTHIAENYGNKGAFTFELGVRGMLIRNLYFGIHIFNPIRAKLAVFGDERLPVIMKAGLAYTFSDKAIIAIETEKDLNFPALFRIGAEYHVIKPLYIRAGISTNPFTNTFGIGLELKNFKIDIAASRHAVLGFSPQVSLIYDIRKPSRK